MARPSSANVPIAVVGMACRLPGANTVEQCWDLVRHGRYTVQPLPEERFNRDLLFDPRKGQRGKSYTDLACQVDYAYRPNTHPIAMPATPDVAYQTIAEVAAEAALDAGLDGRQAQNGGVYLGHVRATGLAADLAYPTCLQQTAPLLLDVPFFKQALGSRADAVVKELIRDARHSSPIREADGGPALGAGVPALLICEGLNFTGRAMAFNSACASSLQALAQASRALQLGNIDIAVAAGASYCHSDTLVMFSQAQSVSAVGSRPFDVDADGMVVGEGYVALVLKTVDRAIRDGDRIHAVIRGIGISSDGRGKSLWAPRGEGQLEAVSRAYECGLDPARLQYIEAHATSTQVGDATELTALAKALDGKLPPHVKIPVGSIKANIGHTLETAGMAGLLKVILALKHRTIPPAINVQQLNPKIDWANIPFQVPHTPTEWPEWSDRHPRRAAVNAFGIGGLNVHVVVDEFSQTHHATTATGIRPGFASESSEPAEPRQRAGEERDAVAIIGMGTVLPGAGSIPALEEMLKSGHSPICEVPASRWHWPDFYQPERAQPGKSLSKLGGFVTDFEYDWRKHKIPPKQIAQASPLQFMILDAVDQALQQAGLDSQTIRERTGVVVGSPFGGQFSLKLMMGLRLPEFREAVTRALMRHGVGSAEVEQILDDYERRFLEAHPALLDETGSFTTSSLASRITKSFDLMGGGVAVDAGWVASGAALSCCVDQILSGDCEQMVCVAGQEDLSPVLYEIWGMRGVLTAGAARTPFDARADGCIPADGCAVLLLRSLAAAERDGNRILGIIRGVGIGQADSLQEGLRIASQRALEQSDLSPRDVTMLESCSTGKPSSRDEELSALDVTYADATRQEPMLLGSLVGQVGHLTAAAGLAAMQRTVLALEARELPGTQPLGEPASCVRDAASKFSISDQPQPIPVANPDGRLVAAVDCVDDGSVYHILIERGTKVERPVHQQPTPAQPQRAVAEPSVEEIEGIPHFDATQRRKAKLRQAGADRERVEPTAAPPAQAPAPVAQAPAAPAPTVRAPIQPAPVQAAPVQPAPTVPVASASRPPAVNSVPTPSAVPAKPPVSAAPPAVASSAATTPSAPSAGPVPAADELEKFMVNFVVEETGYPHEMVEMDADLEADLGIDSIKKAQMLVEMRDSFRLAIEPNDELSLDDFPTLKHILDYVLETASSSSPSPEVAAPGENGRTSQIRSVEVRPAKPSAPPVPATRPATPPASSVPTVTVPAPSVPAPAVPAPAPSSLPSVAELQAFMVTFVVDETGYPEDMVEVDADLEADLGIDSIKKAQMLGEMRDRFTLSLEPNEDLCLDDFPTLQHITDFVVANCFPGASAAPAEASSNPASVPAPPARPATRVVTAAVVTSRPPSVPAAPTTEPPLSSPAPSQQEMAAFMIHFVVEETGYPDEMVELDADLEADLGIDSIKKAQMLGEMRDRFELAIQPSDDLSLDDFPTLQHILEYVVQACSDPTIAAGSMNDRAATISPAGAITSNRTQDHVD